MYAPHPPSSNYNLPQSISSPNPPAPHYNIPQSISSTLPLSPESVYSPHPPSSRHYPSSITSSTPQLKEIIEMLKTIHSLHISS